MQTSIFAHCTSFALISFCRHLKKVRVIRENYNFELMEGLRPTYLPPPLYFSNVPAGRGEILYELPAGRGEILYAIASAKMIECDGVPSFVPGYDYLAVGSVGSAYNKTNLLSSGITHILCVAESPILKFEGEFSYRKIAMHDRSSYDISTRMDECLEYIEECRQVGGKILVHCSLGKSRSVTVVCAYLMKKQHLSLEVAFSLIKDCRPIARPNTGFMKYLKNLDEYYRGEVEIENQNCHNIITESPSPDTSVLQLQTSETEDSTQTLK